MDLKGGQVTLGEILQNPQARAMIRRSRYGFLLESPLLGRFSNLPLQAALDRAGGFLPPQVIRRAVEQLRRL